MHQVAWHIPSPLWDHALQDAQTRRFNRPELLRFDNDAFMDQFQLVLDEGGVKVADLVAQHETWRDRVAGWQPASGSDAFDENEIYKLYQPAHQRFYLVAAQLICQRKGLPDKGLDLGQGEATQFVLRQLIPVDENVQVVPSNPATFHEYGWFGEEKGWLKMIDPKVVDNVLSATSTGGETITEREERVPLFPTTYKQNGNERRILAGLIPVSRRETFETTPRKQLAEGDGPDVTNDALADARLGVYESGVVFGIGGVKDAFELISSNVSPEDTRDAFAYALLDLMIFLEDYLPAVHTAILEGSNAGLAGNNLAVYSEISGHLASAGLSLNTLESLHTNKLAILEGEVDFSGDTTLTGGFSGLDALTNVSEAEMIGLFNNWQLDDLDYAIAGSLNTKVKAALPSIDDVPFKTDEPLANDRTAAGTEGNAGAIYVIRCLYERPKCLLPSHRQVLSLPTQAFRMAPFFDPDAPVRPVRIAMPVDTSIAGLRKFPKNVSFLISDELRKQVDQIQNKNLGDLDDGNLSEGGGWTLGMICSLSIPIITICAFILLMIIVQLLNIVFWWKAFFKICFPIPVKE